jgi:hypothetical protein
MLDRLADPEASWRTDIGPLRQIGQASPIALTCRFLDRAGQNVRTKPSAFETLPVGLKRGRTR